MASCLLLLLPVLAAAKIKIEISGDMTGDEKDLKVHFSGQETDVISDTEWYTFKLSNSILKIGANKYFGRKPEDVFVRSPTRWGDLYKSYGWNQTKRTLRPTAAKILKISLLEPEIVKSKLFESNCTALSTVNAAISKGVQNTVSTSWSELKALTLSQSQNIVYKFEIGTSAIKFESSYGKSESKSQSGIIGSSSGIRVLLKPGQAVVSQLHAAKGTLHVEVEYEASLSGALAANYGEKKYKDAHFWSLPIAGVMKEAGLSNQLVSKEVIKIDVYEGKVVVYDKDISSPISVCRAPCIVTKE